MDKRLILAVAGSGKTTYILSRLNLEERFLLLTYTINNTNNLKNGITERFGYVPKNIRLISYFSFLFSFCYKPFLSAAVNAKGINWNRPPAGTFTLRRDNIAYYLSPGRWLYHNRLAKFIQVKELGPSINRRLEKYFDHVFIDEVQDFAGHDLDLLDSIARASVNHLYVGDFYQHTFDTSTDGATNSAIHNELNGYISHFTNAGLLADSETLQNSYRCSPAICAFIRENLGIEMYSNSDQESIISLIENKEDADRLFNDAEIIKLFYQEHYKYGCYSQNWGGSKGQDHYVDVCVVLNKTTLQKWIRSTLKELPSKTKNKLYVAISRARRNVYFVPDSLYAEYKLEVPA